jgi:hypothetical protein
MKKRKRKLLNSLKKIKRVKKNRLLYDEKLAYITNYVDIVREILQKI